MTKVSAEIKNTLWQLAQETDFRAHNMVFGQAINKARQKLIATGIKKQERGLIIAAHLHELMEVTISVLYEIGQSYFPEEAQHLSVIAVGGFGRGRLAPFSDLDILFLHSSRSAGKIKPLLDYILYALWDAQFTVAQMVHSPATALELAKTDLSACTSFLEMHYIAGQPRLYKEFQARYDTYRKSSITNFVDKKLSERQARLETQNSSRYLTEPNIKEGKGGLRDLDTLQWLANYAFRAKTVNEMVEARIFTQEEGVSFEKALSFLWSVRIYLHDYNGGAGELLKFDIQPILAERLGYKDRGKMLGVERFMKHYFLTAREVGRLTGVICAKLEEAKVKKSRFIPDILKPRIQQRPKKLRDDGHGSIEHFHFRGQRLDFSPKARPTTTPIELFRLYNIAGRAPRCDIHPQARQVVAQCVSSTAQKLLVTPQIDTVFRQIVLCTDDPEATLREMAEAGLLGKYIPAFGVLTGRMVYSLYRQFTLEEHVLRSTGILFSLISGGESQSHPLCHKIIHQQTDKFQFFLCVLLHETASAMHDDDIELVQKKITTSISHFYPENTEIIDKIVWAASHHKLLAHTASRRSAFSAEIVKTLAEKVENQDYLDMLLVLTICHLRVAGVNSWDYWFRRDITSLYEACTAYLKGGDAYLAECLQQRREKLRNQTMRLLGDWPVSTLQSLFDRLPVEFFEAVGPEGAASFAKLTKFIDSDSGQGGVAVRKLKDGFWEVQVYSRDKPGLFANIAGVVAELGMEVRTSSAFPVAATGKGSVMAANIMVFREINNLQVSSYYSDIDLLKEKFEAAITLPTVAELKLQQRIGDRRGLFKTPIKVTLDSDISKDCLVVEARGRDRPGLLYQLAKAITEINLSIRFAYIATYGEVAVDSFYVQTMTGEKVVDPKVKQIIRRRLATTLNKG